jgi:hypothetical protein
MESLLVNLRKYRPRENTDPLENFITEAFAWLLRSDDKVLIGVLKYINQRLENKISIPKERVDISTQTNFNGKYPDLVLSWPSCTWVFEHKVGAPLSNNQLENYRNYIANNSDDYRIILITAKHYQHAQKPHAAMCWEDIYKCLEQIESGISDNQVRWAVNDFLMLLKTEGLGPANPINRFSMSHYLEAIKFDEQIDSVFNAAKHSNWPLARLKMKPEFKREKIEGRVGLSFCPEIGEYGRKWGPGVFCGVMLDGADHGVSKFTNDKLNLCLILDFNKSAQAHIKSTQTFEKFKQSFKEIIKEYFPNWIFIDPTDEVDAKYNAWHPLVILTPMLPIFEDSHNHQEQVNKVNEAFGKIQERLVESDDFNSLVNELSKIDY